jgi:uncharacterized protein
MYERIGRALASFVLRRRAFTLVAGVLFFLVLALGLRRVAFSTDYRIFFSSDDPGLGAFERLERVFTKTDNVLFVVKAKEGSAFQKDVLGAVQELTVAGWKLPYASRVDSVANFPELVVTEDDIVTRPLVPADLADADLARLAKVATSEPLLAGSLVARDGRTVAVNVTLRLPGRAPQEATEAADAARRLVAEVSARHPEIDVRPSGMALMNDAFMQASVRDMGVMIPLMVVVMLLAMTLLMRSALATLAVACVIFLSAALSMAIAGWLGYPLTPPAVAAPMMVLTVAVADGVHIVLAAMDGLREGRSRSEAIVHAVSTNIEAVTYTWLTTIVGFLCLNYSESPPVRHLANMTSFGVTAAYLYSLTFLPALLGVLPLRAPRVRAARHLLLGRLADFVLRRRLLVLAVGAAAAIGGAWHASRLETNDQFVEYFGPSLAFRRDVDFTMKNLSGIYRLEYQVGSETGITDPAYLARLDEFGTWLRAQPEVEHVYGVADVLKRVHQALHDGPYELPASREAAAQELLVYEMGLPEGLDLNDRVNVDKSASRLTATVKDMSTRQLTDFSRRSEAWLKEHTPRAMWTEATGPVVIFSQLSDRNAKSMVQADFVSLALISLCMVLVLRSVKIGLLSVIPNVVPIVVGYGIWRLSVGQMNIVASVAGSVSLGIIVDDTIHFLTKYRAYQRAGTDPVVAIRATLVHVGGAMLATSGVLVAGFGVLTFSAFQMTSYLGWLSVLVVTIAPVCDLFLVPALVVSLASQVRAPRRQISLEPLETGAT